MPPRPLQGLMIGDGIRSRNRNDDTPTLFAVAGWVLFAVALLACIVQRSNYQQLERTVQSYRYQVEQQIALAMNEAHRIDVALQECQTKRANANVFATIFKVLGALNGVPPAF